MEKLKKLILIALAGLFFLSCSPAKRLQRLVRQHPELLAATDTVSLDTVLTVPPIATDTATFVLPLLKPGTYKVKSKDNRVVATLVKTGDTLQISAEYVGQSLSVNLKKSVKKIVVQPPEKDPWYTRLLKKYCVLLMLAFIAVVLVRANR